MTNSEKIAVEQQTRIREARFMLRSIADDADAPPEPIESELRTMSRRLGEIEKQYEASLSIRNRRADAGQSRKTEGGLLEGQ